MQKITNGTLASRSVVSTDSNQIEASESQFSPHLELPVIRQSPQVASRNNKYAAIAHTLSPTPFPNNEGPGVGGTTESILRGIDITKTSFRERSCSLQLTNMCTWPHCNPTCPKLLDPYTGQCLLSPSPRLMKLRKMNTS